MPRVVTLTTDFGPSSGYVAEVKGVILHAVVPVTLVDIAHDFPPHDIRAAARLLERCCFAFPPGTIHLAVVDPGVGTGRRLVHARIGTHDFLCPDNGLLTLALRRAPLAFARPLDVPRGAAATFHGRDVLAPFALRLLAAPDAAGTVAPADGPTIPGEELVRCCWPEPRESATGIAGEVVHVDAFGNLETNLPAALLPRLVAAGRIEVGDRSIGRIVRTYGDAPPGTAVALLGSQGCLEVAVVEGNAADRLLAGVGTPVTIPAR